MQKLSVRKLSSIVKLYLGGFSHDEIAALVGVSKGTVASVVADLRVGRILDAQEPAEEEEHLAVPRRPGYMKLGQTKLWTFILHEAQDSQPDHLHRKQLE